ncbi:hypothetical protein WH96_18835 [Kiloniella spongiae]|uniref:Uncharacterized protein n=1 Tax=Kiloniella spongiae TaxID=1489064 RepID=A0A0H2M9J7_9PROT|nr:hypothetical protein WH96_18835 [Kiloniella spongiae]
MPSLFPTGKSIRSKIIDLCGFAHKVVYLGAVISIFVILFGCTNEKVSRFGPDLFGYPAFFKLVFSA